MGTLIFQTYITAHPVSHRRDGVLQLEASPEPQRMGKVQFPKGRKDAGYAAVQNIDSKWTILQSHRTKNTYRLFSG